MFQCTPLLVRAYTFISNEMLFSSYEDKQLYGVGLEKRHLLNIPHGVNNTYEICNFLLQCFLIWLFVVCNKKQSVNKSLLDSQRGKDTVLQRASRQ